jgi:hypothetical protein
MNVVITIAYVTSLALGLSVLCLTPIAMILLVWSHWPGFGPLALAAAWGGVAVVAYAYVIDVVP